MCRSTYFSKPIWVVAPCNFASSIPSFSTEASFQALHSGVHGRTEGGLSRLGPQRQIQQEECVRGEWWDWRKGPLNPTADRAQEWGPTESGAGVLKTQSQGCPILGSVFTVLSESPHSGYRVHSPCH